LPAACSLLQDRLRGQLGEMKRLGYLDWMRGLAAAIMLQGHVFEGWVRADDRAHVLYWFSQFLGGMPAPIFFFLVGASLALIIDKMRNRQTPGVEMARTIIRRSLWILVAAYVFRLQQFLFWYPHSRWTDISKVDTLNLIGASMLLLGLASLVFSGRRLNAALALTAAALVVFLTPFIYTLRVGAPVVLQSYLNGGGRPDYFGLIPWIGFPLCGLAFGHSLVDARRRQAESRFFAAVAIIGLLAASAGVIMSRYPRLRYGFFDDSLTSPYFFLARLGWLLLLLCGAYLWSRRSTAHRWSPLITLGQASLLVYWLHIEIVYGRLGGIFGRALTLQQAALQLIWLFPLMVLLAHTAPSWRRTGARIVTGLSAFFPRERAARSAG